MRPLAVILLGILLGAIYPQNASAQIVNTLRGFDDEELGWSGSIEGSIAIADGNTDYQEYAVAGAMQRQTKRTRWRLLASASRRTASGEEIAESRMAHLRHNFLVLPRIASIAFAQAQYEPFKRLKSRFLLGAGARADVFKGNKWNGAVGASAMLEHEELTGDVGRVANDVRYSFFLTVFRDVAEGTDIDLVGFYQPRVEDPRDARANMIASVRSDVVGDLYVFVRYDATYDSSPPIGVEDLDQNMRAGLGYDF